MGYPYQGPRPTSPTLRIAVICPNAAYPNINPARAKNLPFRPLFKSLDMLSKNVGGWGGIRTHETFSRLPVFKTGAFNRSATHPRSP